MKMKLRTLRSLIRETLTQVDTDPANNPGRPADAFEYLGMHPNPAWAMAHPSSPGGGSSGADGSSEAEGGGDQEVSVVDPVEPTEDS